MGTSVPVPQIGTQFLDCPAVTVLTLQLQLLSVTFVTSEYTYLLTPWSRVLLEKLASLQLVKKFPSFYGTRRFLTALTSARHLSLS